MSKGTRPDFRVNATAKPTGLTRGNLPGEDAIEDQSVKTVRIRRIEQPSKMHQTPDANRNSPAISRKPAELIRRRPHITAPFDSSKTPDLKNNSMGVGKGMLVRALDGDPFGRMRYDIKALTATDKGFGIQFVLFSLVFNKTFDHFNVLFFWRNTKKIRQRQIRRYHFLPSLNRTCLADENVFKRPFPWVIQF